MSYSHSIVTELRRKTSGEFETPIKLGAEQKNVGALLNSYNNNLEEQSILGLDYIEAIWNKKYINYSTKKYYNPISEPKISSSGYYILFSKDNTNPTVEFEEEDYIYDNGVLYLPTYDIGSLSFEQQSDGVYSLVGVDNSLYAFDNDDIIFYTDHAELCEFFFGGETIYFPSYGVSKVKFLEREDNEGFYFLIDDESICFIDDNEQTLKVNPSFKIHTDVLCLRTDTSNTSDTQISSDILISEKNVTQKISEENRKYISNSITNYLS